MTPLTVVVRYASVDLVRNNRMPPQTGKQAVVVACNTTGGGVFPRAFEKVKKSLSWTKEIKYLASGIHKFVHGFEPWGIVFVIVGLLATIIGFLLEVDDRQSERIFRAWEIVFDVMGNDNLAEKQVGSSAVRQALEYLNRNFEGEWCGGLIKSTSSYLTGNQSRECVFPAKHRETFVGISLPGMDFSFATLPEVVLRRATLNDSTLRRADLRNAQFQYANLKNANLMRAVLRLANFENADLRGAFLVDSQLQRADLRSADLRDAILAFSNLENAKLNDADLQNADLQHANLKGADLTGANLKGAILKNADLTGTNLKDAQIEGANFEGAELEGVKLEEAIP